MGALDFKSSGGQYRLSPVGSIPTRLRHRFTTKQPGQHFVRGCFLYQKSPFGRKKLFTAVRIKTSYKKSIEPVVKPIYNQIAHSLKYGTIKKL